MYIGFIKSERSAKSVHIHFLILRTGRQDTLLNLLVLPWRWRQQAPLILYVYRSTWN